MYKHLFILALVAMGLNACGPVYVVQQAPPPPAPAEPPPANPEDVSYQTFYDQLSPYGQWIEDPQYGYVWMPEVGADFKPYATGGHWVYTDEGWAWNSDYPWGWAAFHYGRWFFRDGYGWMWVPGTDWAPAWVSWRNSDDYYGWAPMEPGISVGVAYSSGYNPPPHYWCFVPHQYVASPQINNYYVRETNNVTIINRTTVINNTTIINHYGNNRYGAGPDPNEVGRFSGSPLRATPIRESRVPGAQGTGGGLTVYRPHVNSAPQAGNTNNNNRPAFAPTRFQTLNNARPMNHTNYGSNGAPGNNPQANNNPPVPNPPASNPPANNGWNNNRQNNNPPANNNNWNNRPNNNPAAQPGRPFQPAGQPATQQPATRQPITQQPTTQQPATQPASSNRAQFQRRPFTPATNQNNGSRNATPQNTNQPRPVGNAPKPAPPQHNPPPPPKKDDGRDPNKP